MVGRDLGVRGSESDENRGKKVVGSGFAAAAAAQICNGEKHMTVE